MTRRPRVFMLDLLATVPYYTAYLSRALLRRGVPVQIGSITYYLDTQCFSSRGLQLRPGCMDVVGRFPALPRTVRRVLKLGETALNHLASAVRMMVRPPEIVHVQFLPLLRSALPMDDWLLRLLRWRGARVVLTVHDLLPHDTADRHREVYRRLYGRVDQLICHSASVADRLAREFGVAADRIHTIPHGPFFYDLPADAAGADGALRARYSLAPQQQVVLWQGILFPYKGVDVLLDAWAEVERKTSAATLLVVGTGSPELLAAARAQAEQLGLRNVVFDARFVSTEELAGLYRAASVVVYPYRAITTSGALATGMAMGKAIVASDLSVFREMLTDGTDALLVPAGETAPLAAALLQLLGDAALRARLQSAVQARDFGDASWQAIAAQTEDVYVAALRDDTYAAVAT